ncbi:hypothetical protein RCL1_001068 [Eukaryota sp. TZLM3-RCL]
MIQDFDDIPHEQILEYKHLFQLFDQDNDGAITADEIFDVCKALSLNYEKNHILTLISKHDTNADGLLDFKEFSLLLASRYDSIDPIASIIESFRTFDPYDEGTIKVSDLLPLLKSLGDSFNPDEFNSFLQDIKPFCENGMLNYREFAKIGLK